MFDELWTIVHVFISHREVNATTQTRLAYQASTRNIMWLNWKHAASLSDMLEETSEGEKAAQKKQLQNEVNAFKQVVKANAQCNEIVKEAKIWIARDDAKLSDDNNEAALATFKEQVDAVTAFNVEVDNIPDDGDLEQLQQFKDTLGGLKEKIDCDKISGTWNKLKV